MACTGPLSGLVTPGRDGNFAVNCRRLGGTFECPLGTGASFVPSAPLVRLAPFLVGAPLGALLGGEAPLPAGGIIVESLTLGTGRGVQLSRQLGESAKL